MFKRMFVVSRNQSPTSSGQDINWKQSTWSILTSSSSPPSRMSWVVYCSCFLMVRQDFSSWSVIVLTYMVLVGANALDILCTHHMGKVMSFILGMIHNDSSSKCCRHALSWCAYERHYPPPLNVHHFEYFQGGELLVLSRNMATALQKLRQIIGKTRKY